MATDGAHNLSSGEVVIYAIVVVLLVLGAGLMSGLTLGLLSLDVMDLEVLRVSGSSSQRNGAARLLPLVTKPHWLLCTLLLCNAACMEALPLFLDRLLDPIGAILLSVTAILVFGEIIPQAVCSRFGVLIGAKLAPMVRLLMWFCAPITWPLGKLLDAVLGHEDPVMKRGELKAMVQLHGEGAGLGGKLTTDEVNVIHGAMDLTHKTAVGAMTPMPKVFMLSDCDVLDEKLLQQILQSGHSRVPVYRGADREDIIGLILVKEILQFWRSAESKPLVGQLDIRHMPQIPADCPMFDVLRLFQTGNSHMALLLAPSGIDVDEFRRNFSWLRSNENDDSSSCSSSGSSSSSSGSPYSANAQLASASEKGEEGVRTPTGKPYKHQHRDHKHSSSKSKSRHLSRRGSAASSLAGSLFGGGGGGDATAVAAGGAEAEAGAAADAAESRSSKPFKLLRFNIGSRKSASFSRSKNGAAASPMADQQQQQGSHGHVALEVQQLAASGAAAGLEAGCSAEQQQEQQQQQSQMTALGVPRFAPVGIITLEDVMEELMQHEIVDETDAFMDNEQTEKVDLEKLMSGLPPRLHALLRAEMLAAAQNFVKQSVWNPTPELNPNNIRHSTAIRVTGTLGRSMASGTAGGGAGARQGLQQQPVVAAGGGAGSAGGLQGVRPTSAGGAPAAAGASGSGSGVGPGLAALRVAAPRTPRSPLAAGAGASPMCNALFAAAAAAGAASGGAAAAPRSPFGQHRASAPGNLQAATASNAVDALVEATIPAVRQPTAPLSLGAAAAEAGIIGGAGAGAASAAISRGPTLRTFKSIKRVQSGGGLEAVADAAAAAAGLGDGASSSGGAAAGTSSSQAGAC